MADAAGRDFRRGAGAKALDATHAAAAGFHAPGKQVDGGGVVGGEARQAQDTGVDVGRHHGARECQHPHAHLVDLPGVVATGERHVVTVRVHRAAAALKRLRGRKAPRRLERAVIQRDHAARAQVVVGRRLHGALVDDRRAGVGTVAQECKRAPCRSWSASQPRRFRL